MSRSRGNPAKPDSPGPHRLAAIITGLYVILGAFWITFFDQIVTRLAASYPGLSTLQTYEGLGFVAVTGLLLYLSVVHFTRALTRNRDYLRVHGERLARLNRAHAIVRSVDDVLLHGTDETLLLESTARTIVEQGGFPLVWIALYDHDGRELKPVASAAPGIRSPISGSPVTLAADDRSILIHALYRGQLQVATGSSDGLVDRIAGVRDDIASIGAFPLRGTGDTRGVLVIHAAEADVLADQEEAMLLSRVADTLALGLDYSWQRQTLDRLNYHDPVTGVGNRNLIENRLAGALNEAAWRETAVAVLVVDIDNFRAVNEAAGHAVGDRVLARVGQVLGRVIRPGDTLGRLANDEFGVLLHEVPRTEDVSRLVNRLADQFPQTIAVDGFSFELSVSIGVAVYPDDAHDAAELLSSAELALQSQKPGRDAAISYYAPELDRRASEQRVLETALRNADFDREFRLAWQPVIGGPEQRVCAAEVLLRWHNGELGEIEPARFIPLAEQSGTIRGLGRWVLAHACAQARAWADAGQPIDIAVNIALEQLQDRELVTDVRRLLDQYGSKDWTLVLELTESQFMADPGPVSAVCRQLQELGCKIHLDDFGTGYSALNYLMHLPLDGIKLDRTFVQQIGEDPGVYAVTEAVIGLADKLGLEVIAEGVETREQLIIVRQLGARNIQGFLFGRPAPAEEMLRTAVPRFEEERLAN